MQLYYSIVITIIIEISIIAKFARHLQRVHNCVIENVTEFFFLFPYPLIGPHSCEPSINLRYFVDRKFDSVDYRRQIVTGTRSESFGKLVSDSPFGDATETMPDVRDRFHGTRVNFNSSIHLHPSAPGSRFRLRERETSCRMNIWKVRSHTGNRRVKGRLAV